MPGILNIPTFWDMTPCTGERILRSLNLHTLLLVLPILHMNITNLYRLATGWTVRGSNPGGGEIFLTCPYRPWGSPSLLHNGYRVSFSGVKRRGRGVDHPPPSSAEVKERVDLYLYSPSGSLWPVLG